MTLRPTSSEIAVMNLDDMKIRDDAGSSSPAVRFDARRAITPAALAAVTLLHETAETTYLALAEYYDTRRDKAVENMARVIAAYGTEAEKKGAAMTAAIAAPFLTEARRMLDSADKFNVSAALNRKFYLENK